MVVLLLIKQENDFCTTSKVQSIYFSAKVLYHVLVKRNSIIYCQKNEENCFFDHFILIKKTQCRNSRILLLIRIYVKSILQICEYSENLYQNQNCSLWHSLQFDWQKLFSDFHTVFLWRYKLAALMSDKKEFAICSNCKAVKKVGYKINQLMRIIYVRKEYIFL